MCPALLKRCSHGPCFLFTVLLLLFWSVSLFILFISVRYEEACRDYWDWESVWITLTYLPEGDTYGYYSKSYYQGDWDGRVSQLHLNGNQISDLTVLEKLTNLSQLFLSRNQISDLAALEKLTNLSGL